MVDVDIGILKKCFGLFFASSRVICLIIGANNQSVCWILETAVHTGE